MKEKNAFVIPAKAGIHILWILRSSRRMTVWLGAFGLAILPLYSVFASDFKLTSPVFREGEVIPRKYTCDAENISPPLEWGGTPGGAQSFALIADDPDAPAGVWTHWVIFDLPPTIHNLPEGLPPIDRLANGEVHGINDFKKKGYGGPCPPQGSHRYFFRLYALDTELRLEPGISAKGLKSAMNGHVIAEAGLMGRYQRTKG